MFRAQKLVRLNKLTLRCDHHKSSLNHIISSFWHSCHKSGAQTDVIDRQIKFILGWGKWLHACSSTGVFFLFYGYNTIIMF